MLWMQTFRRVLEIQVRPRVERQVAVFLAVLAAAEILSTATQRQLGTSQVPPARQLTSGSSGGGSGGNTGGSKVTGKGVGSTVGKALGTLSGVLMVVDGANNLSESVAGTEKATWKDVGRGALGGAETAGGQTMTLCVNGYWMRARVVEHGRRLVVRLAVLV